MSHRGRTRHGWKKAQKQSPRSSALKPLWSERRNLLGWLNADTGAIYTVNGSLSLPWGGDEQRMILVLAGKKSPTRAFRDRLEARDRLLDATDPPTDFRLIQQHWSMELKQYIEGEEEYGS